MRELRQFLLDLPEHIRCDVKQLPVMRAALRSRLFASATCGEKYLSLLFDDVAEPLKGDLEPEDWLGSTHRSHNHGDRPCIHKLGQGEPTYRCLTCGLDDTCVLCEHCFNADDHEGHEVFVKITNRDDGGICDCGDLEAWTTELHCKAAEEVVSDPVEMPADFQEAVLNTCETALDFVLDVLCTSHSGLQFFDSEEQVLQNEKESELDPEVYGMPTQVSDSKYVLQMWNDERHTFEDAKTAIHLATHRSSEFGFMIASRVDSYGRAVVAISNNIPQLLASKSIMNLLTVTVRSVRDYLREEMCDEIIHWLHNISRAYLRNNNTNILAQLVGTALLRPWRVGNKQLRRSQESPLPSASASVSYPQHIWKHSILDGPHIPPMAHVETVGNEQQPLTQEGHEVDIDTSGLTFTDILQGFQEKLRSVGSDAAIIGEPSPIWRIEAEQSERLAEEMRTREAREGTSRAKLLVFFDIRLWKSVRITLGDLYVSALISNTQHKAELGRIYAELYPQVSELYVLADREPEASVISSLSTQLFTTPSVATELMAGPYFGRYIAALYTLFTSQEFGSPSDISTGASISMNSQILRNRRFGQLFHEIVFLMSRNTTKINIVGSTRRLMMVADFLSLFQGLSPMKRQIEKHIEFESDTWVFLFTTIPFILQLAQSVALGAAECPFELLKDGLETVSQILLKWSSDYQERLSKGKPLQLSLSTSYGGHEIERVVSAYHVEEGLVSLHHPVHIFLAYLLQNSRIPSVEALREVLYGPEGTVTGIYDRDFTESLLFESPLQSMAVLSQIHVGLWVRNGYSVRSQLHHYRESTLREMAFMSDIYLAQTALIALDTNSATLQLLNRWNMIDWVNDPLFDESQSYYMLEEFLHTLTYLLVDRIYLQGFSEQRLKEELYRREIIECLTFRDMSFSEMSQFIPEAMTTEDLFEPVLRECASFTPPKGVRDAGIYSLKDELKIHFDTHYTHFSSARIEEAEGMIAEHMSKKHGTRPEDVVHLPPLTALSGPFGDLGAFTRSVTFARFILDLFRTMLENYGGSNQVHVETVLSKALHLLLRAAQDDITRDRSLSTTNPDVFPTLATWFVLEDQQNGVSLATLIRQIISNPQLSSLHARSRKLFILLHECDPVSIGAICGTMTISEDPIERESDKKKRHGKEVQAKIMEDMKRQQELFAKNYENEKDESHDGVQNMETEDEDTEAGWAFPKGECVLCHMPDSDDSIFGIMTYTGHTKIHRRMDADIGVDWIAEGYAHQTSSLDVSVPYDPNDIPGEPAWHEFWKQRREEGDIRAYPMEATEAHTVTIGCGHGIHYSCYEEFVKLQAARSQQLTRMPAELAQNGEYLCPLCRGLNNGFMPVMWKRNTLSASEFYKQPENCSVELARLFSIIEEPYEVEISRLIEAGSNNFLPKFENTFHNEHIEGPVSKSSCAKTLLSQMARINESSGINKSNVHEQLWGLQNIFKAFASTVSAMEISLRGIPHEEAYGNILVNQLSNNQVQLLRVMTQYIRTLVSFLAKSCNDDSSKQSSYAPLGVGFIEPLDPIVRLVEGLFYSSPGYGISPATTIITKYTTSIVQFLHQVATFKEDLSSLPVQSTPSDVAIKVITSIVKNQDPRIVYGMLIRHITVFLRKVALITFGICGDFDSDDFAFMMAKPEHERLSLYLCLPLIDQILANIFDKYTIEGWIAGKMSEKHKFAPLEYPGAYHLIHLPERLDSFFNTIKTKSMPTDRAICLFCGDMISWQHSVLANNERGPANKHIAECAKEYGLYILPKRNSILLLTNDERGAFTRAPYLDLHGESDENMRRGRPHYLHLNRYEAFARTVWLENGLTSFVGRKLDQSIDHGGWETL